MPSYVPACKPGSVGRTATPKRSGSIRTVISLGARSPARSSSLPAASSSGRAVPRRLFGLAPTGVYLPRSVAGRVVGSYPNGYLHRSTAYSSSAGSASFHPCLIPRSPAGHRRFRFCGTIRRRYTSRLTTPRSYLAACPAEPGLSSGGAPERPLATIRPTRSTLKPNKLYPFGNAAPRRRPAGPAAAVGANQGGWGRE